MDRIGYETTQTVHYFQIDGSRSMTPAALLSALQEMAISHSDSLGFSVQYNLTHHCFWSVVNWHLKLYRMPKYNETITLQTWSDKFARFQANRSFSSLMKTAISCWTVFPAGFSWIPKNGSLPMCLRIWLKNIIRGRYLPLRAKNSSCLKHRQAG